jgi:hypothetical protein
LADGFNHAVHPFSTATSTSEHIRTDPCPVMAQNKIWSAGPIHSSVAVRSKQDSGQAKQDKLCDQSRTTHSQRILSVAKDALRMRGQPVAVCWRLKNLPAVEQPPRGSFRS